MPDPADRLARWAEAHFGFVLLPAQRAEAAAMIAERAEANRMPDRGAYLDALESGRLGPDEADRLAERLTVGETFFFRHPEQIRALVEIALPERQEARGGLPLKVLSAGCATGEEPYTVAIAARDAGLDHPAPRITAVDLNPSFLTRARAARYGRWSLRALPDAVARRDFHPSGELSALDPAIAGQVTFAGGNLADPNDPIFRAHSWDAIVCRNVLIYFPPARMAEVIGRLANALVPGGWLVLGPAETARGLSDLLELREARGAFLYRRRTGDRPRSPTGPLRTSRPPSHVATLVEVRGLVVRERFVEAERLLGAVAPLEASAPEGRLLAGLCRLGVGDFAAAGAIGRTLAIGVACAAEGAHLVGLASEARAAGAAGLAKEAEAPGALDPVGTLAEARRWHAKAIALDPGLATAHGRLAALDRRAGDDGAARDGFGRALACLDAEPPERLALFAGGFGAATLRALWLAELARGGVP